MTARACVRLTVTSAVLLVGVVTASCGGDGGSDGGAAGGGGNGAEDRGAPTGATTTEFCATQTDFLTDLVPRDTTRPEVPSDEEMAQAVKAWGADLAEVGTPEGIPDDARAGFEALVEQAAQVDASDFSIEELEELQAGGADASEEARKQADAFATYLTETCGNPLDDIELPQLPETSGSTG
ncbi:hypothetical protein HN031_07800 [Nocardioides sp. zg-1308]|uniref:hypothetical protein n=1 Tax=Nocardioides sp. zg-1308 TaxID=2736253 RepID=UPI0015554B16|nr:hypothetical protein [Nocardioides sp. zg-1308]NPD04586.1 hypothetical protein [Nocardioides sp. zg-1308]